MKFPPIPRLLQSRWLGRLPVTLLIWAASTSCGHAANEAALLELWKGHLASPANHEAVRKACQKFVASNPADPLIPVAQGIEVWHLLQAGNQAEATRILEAQLVADAPPGPVTDGARLLAKGWLTRFDREKAVAALQLYYRKEIAYPPNLEALALHPAIPPLARPPAADRFGKPWSYQLVGYGNLAGFANQKYLLQSTELGGFSDLRAILKAPYGASIQAELAEVFARDPANVAVKFAIPKTARTIVLGIGNNASGLHLAFVGTQIVVVCDAACWKIFPKP